MKYKTLRKAFHDPSVDEEELYASRFNSESAVKIGCNIGGYPAFFILTPSLTAMLVKAAKVDKEIFRLIQQLPGKAISDYANACLIDEIVLTNEIENVHSTRREISDVLETLEKSDKKKRFRGIVAKYDKLLRGGPVFISTCSDVRNIYDDLVFREVCATDSGKAPDGRYFRTGSVSVVDGAGQEIHHGVQPESKIIEMMECMLAFLENEEVDVLVRTAVSHFLFGYIHPFYDGNGRTNRFISSSIIAGEYEKLVGLRLSFAIKEEIGRYYKAFMTCEHPLNKGDLTPFVIEFVDIVLTGMERLREALAERDVNLRKYEALAWELYGGQGDKASYELVRILIVARLFALYGVMSNELCEVLGITKPTLQRRFRPLKDAGLVHVERVGHKVYYACELDELERQVVRLGSVEE